MYHLGPHGSSMMSLVPLYPPAFGSVIPRVVCILKVTCYLKKSYCGFTPHGCTPERGRQKKSLPVRLLGRTFSEAHFLIPVYISLTTASTREAGKVGKLNFSSDFQWKYKNMVSLLYINEFHSNSTFISPICS